MSRPLWVSLRRRNAWCGLFAELPSCAVKMTRNVSAPANTTGLDSGLDEVNLFSIAN